MKTKTFFFLCLFLSIGLTQLSAQTWTKGSVIAINTYTFTLNPDKTLNQMLDFYVNKYIPEYEKNFPGVKEYILWGDRGEKKNQIAIVDVFESVAVRDKYYPTEGSEGSDVAKAAGEKMKALNDELGKFFMNGGPRVYTDWIVK
jgi:hypothetical protein